MTVLSRVSTVEYAAKRRNGGCEGGALEFELGKFCDCRECEFK